MYIYIHEILYIYTCIYISYIYVHEIYIYIHEILLNCKKKEILPLAAIWMGLQNIIFNEISQKNTSFKCTISFIC